MCTSQAQAAQVQFLGYSPKAQAQLDLCFVPSPARAAQAARSLMGTLSRCAVCLIPSAVPASVFACAGWVHLVSLLGSWFLAATLPADVNHPESQEVFGERLEACLQFGRRCRLWGQVCLFPVLAGATSPLPPASSGGWAGPQPASSSLVFGPSFVLVTGG